MTNRARATLAPSRDRPVHVPVFGAHLRDLRGDQTIADVCRAVRVYGFALDHSTLIHYERGTVKAPDPALLFALAHHYEVEEFDHLVHLLVRERLGRPVRAVFVSHHRGSRYSRDQRRLVEWFAELSDRSREALLFTLRKFREVDQPARPEPVRRRGRS